MQGAKRREWAGHEPGGCSVLPEPRGLLCGPPEPRRNGKDPEASLRTWAGRALREVLVLTMPRPLFCTVGEPPPMRHTRQALGEAGEMSGTTATARLLAPEPEPSP